MGKKLAKVLEGLARCMDISGSMENYPNIDIYEKYCNDNKTPEQIDGEALAGDWDNVGKCLRKALDDYPYHLE